MHAHATESVMFVEQSVLDLTKKKLIFFYLDFLLLVILLVLGRRDLRYRMMSFSGADDNERSVENASSDVTT